MTESIMLLLGATVLLIALYDFFFTTLSGSGTGFVTEYTSIVSDKIIRSSSKLLGRKTYNYRGVLVNLLVLSFWIVLVWIGLFLIYSSDPEAITNSDGRVANIWERLYFTGYTISTLGMGNFKPTSAIFELLTSIFSIFGFIFFTTSMTYFISVSSALVNKRTITKTIISLGDTPQRISQQLLNFSSSHFLQQLVSLQTMIDRHAVNHHAYPVVHFYSHSKKEDSFSINISRLDEALSLLNSSNDQKYQEDLKAIRKSIWNFLSNLDNNFSSSMPKAKNEGDFSELPYEISSDEIENIQSRRRILERLLNSEGYSIEEITR